MLGANETCPPMVKVRKGNVAWFVVDRGILLCSPGYSLSLLCKGGGDASRKKVGLSVDFGKSGLMGPFFEFFCPQGLGFPDVFLAHGNPVFPSAYEREIRIPGSSETFQERVTFRPIFSGGTCHAALLDQLYHAFRENLKAEAVSIRSGSGKIIRGYPSTLGACAESSDPYLKKHPGFYLWTLEQGNRWLDAEKKQARPTSLLESALKAMTNNLVGYEIEVDWRSGTSPGDIVHVGPMYLDLKENIRMNELSDNVFTGACFEIAGQYYKGITSD